MKIYISLQFRPKEMNIGHQARLGWSTTFGVSGKLCILVSLWQNCSKCKRDWCISAKWHTLNYFYNTDCNDEDEGQDLGVGKDILDQSSPLHIGTVYKDQHTWDGKEESFKIEFRS